jgi:hypothetical protein
MAAPRAFCALVCGTRTVLQITRLYEDGRELEALALIKEHLESKRAKHELLCKFLPNLQKTIGEHKCGSRSFLFVAACIEACVLAGCNPRRDKSHRTSCERTGVPGTASNLPVSTSSNLSIRQLVTV